ncbi:MAG: magnesium-translocating P-type ATPase [Bacteroidetes bacterium]|nr:magnesium-translocating P-type ATPase [Bacteroidota bacterium]MBI3482508.1 magnesium-translocating P-type ATPase [Bacteroidota bacterium]
MSKSKEIEDAGLIQFWSTPIDELTRKLDANFNGLSGQEARRRGREDGPNRLSSIKEQSSLSLLLNQFKSPITIILLFAACLSMFLGEATNTFIIFFIIMASAGLSFWQELGARGAVRDLLSVIKIKTSVTRNGALIEIPIEEIVTGDVISLRAGDIIPGDCRIINSKDLFIDEASLTGETFPVEKSDQLVSADAPLAKRFNSLFMGTHVVSGLATALVVYTGIKTEFGEITKHLSSTVVETDFEVGVRKFGYLLMEVTSILVITIFAINIYFHRPVIDSLLFSLALAVGLTPQLLPAIISINLSHGAKNIAKKKVIVKKLSCIENFGSMNVLCADKTGTLTEGSVQVREFMDWQGIRSNKTQLYSYLNSYYETGFKNPIDGAIIDSAKLDISPYTKADEIPYDFIRKRLSIVINSPSGHIVITKGAFQNIIECCTKIEVGETSFKDIQECRSDLVKRFEHLSKQGLRVIAIAYKNISEITRIEKDEECGLIFLGFITFYDPPKEGIIDTISSLKKMGITLKMITGDNRYIAADLGEKVFSRTPKILTGKEMHAISDEALVHRVNAVNIFAEIEPNQKEKILLALKKSGNVVGYMGDGINDASALHVADVGISVNTAVDIAKESADIVLLDKDLNVLMEGVKEGRRTFANTLKYILMASSANFGNMFSMAGASLFLPYLPLLPSQILLTNLLTDLPEMTIASDNVEKETITKPRKWDLKFIRKFMIRFGLLSSVFDFATFGVLLFLLKADKIQFRTGWFVESVVSASLIVLIVRSPNSIFKSRPSRYLLAAVLLTGMMTLLIPISPLAGVLGFEKLPFGYIAVLLGLVLCYIVSAEMLKRFFFRHAKLRKG